MSDRSALAASESVWRRVVRALMGQMHRHLPASVYSPIHDGLLALYRGLRRSVYAISIAGTYRDPQERAMKRAVLRVLPRSLVGPSGLEATYRIVRSTCEDGVPGALVECGVARGGASALMMLASADAGQPDRDVWLFDSFEGMPEHGSEDVDPETGRTGSHLRPLPPGSCLGTEADVRDTLAHVVGGPSARANLIPGWFQDTVSTMAPEVGQIAVLRLDGDWYDSTRVCLEAFVPHVSPGGWVIIDDYDSCVGSQRAVDEYLEAKSIPAALVSDGSGGRAFRMRQALST